MARHRKHEDHVNHEAWAIPYGDLVTLLLALFVVMYAISTVNEGKYRAVSHSLSAAFAGTPQTIQPVQIGDNLPSGGTNNAVQLDLQRSPVEQGPTQLDTHANADGLSAMDRIVGEVEANMSELIKQDTLAVRRKDYGVEVEIRTDLLYPSGSATLSPTAAVVLRQLANTLKELPHSVRVEGHTDNQPINTIGFPSNWELSAARAAGVVNLFMQSGVDPARMSVVGQGEFRPLTDNSTDQGRNINRRVLVVILNDNQPSASNAPNSTAAPASNQSP
jgi:chemotaxis protein MotB